VDVLAKKLDSVRTIALHPKDKEPVLVRKGRFGPYVQHGGKVANLPRGVAMEEIGLDEAIALLADKGKPIKAKPGARKPAARKAVATDAEPAPRKPAAKAKAKTPAKAKAKTPARSKAV
jgi:DNA topoisomerase-1